MFQLNERICEWRNYLHLKGRLTDNQLEEAESHLRDEIDDLMSQGLNEEEAFLIAVKRFGNTHSVSKEYSKNSTDQIWKQLVLIPEDPEEKNKAVKENLTILSLSAIAVFLIQIPQWLGRINLSENPEYFFRRILILLPLLLGYYFFQKNHSPLKNVLIFLGIYLISAVSVNLYPNLEPYHTSVLTLLHLPIGLWLLIGFLYGGKQWREKNTRMNFLRMTGEVFIYGVLISLGVGTLGVIIAVMFDSIDINTSHFLGKSFFPSAVMIIPVIAVYFVEAKKSVVENIAPILAKLFTPFFLITLLIYLAVMIVTMKSPYAERELLIGFDLLLAIVLGITFYSISARDTGKSPELFDYMSFGLIISALIVNGVALTAILFRLTSFGITANKTAALGENLILLTDLAGLAWYYFQFFRKKDGFDRIEQWQTGYLEIIFGWVMIVALIFPLLFGFR